MLGAKLKTVLITNKTNQVEAAKKLGVSVACVNQWIRDKRTPSIEDIQHICKTFNTTPNYLMGFDDITPQDQALLSAFKAMATTTQSQNPTENIQEQKKVSER